LKVALVSLIAGAVASWIGAFPLVIIVCQSIR
jgi:hypothetical protein